MLSASAITKRLGAQQVLSDLTLRVEQGDSVAVMGPSGSGKTTLLRCLSSSLAVDGGDIEFDGVFYSELTAAERADLRLNKFGFVFQFAELLPELTAQQNAALTLLLRGVRRRVALSHAGEWLERLDISALADRRPAAMSGGEQQRVAIARALIGSPKILFADEPTGSLDDRNTARVLDTLLGVVADEDLALVIATHDYQVAERASRVVRFSAGAVRETSVPR